MPYIKDKNLVNIYEEVDKANQTINKLNELLREEEENNTILKKHRILLGIFGLILFILFLWSFLPKTNPRIDNNYLEKNNLTIIDNDSLAHLQDAALVTGFEDETLDEEDPALLEGETVIYSIQIGAFNNFKARLFSDDLAHLKEFKDGNLNKYAIGNFLTYKEALVLKNDLRSLGFKDCFIIAKSFGEPINIREALQLSDETQYLK